MPSTLQLQPCPEHHRSKQKTQHGKAALAKSLQVLCFLHFVNCYACMHSRGVSQHVHVSSHSIPGPSV